jgi:hypothetical protein
MASRAGYSGTPLAKKLGIKEGHRLVVMHAPVGFTASLEPLPAPLQIHTTLRSEADVIALFCRSRAELAARLPSAHKKLAPSGGLWVAWPKKASQIATDMTEDVVRQLALPRGLVDNKVCAIDDIWSGLRVVIRKELRPATKR